MNDWVTLLGPALAVRVIGYVPAVPRLAVPLNERFADEKVMPLGSVPVLVTVALGYEYTETWKLNGVPIVAIADDALSISAATYTRTKTVKGKIWRLYTHKTPSIRLSRRRPEVQRYVRASKVNKES